MNLSWQQSIGLAQQHLVEAQVVDLQTQSSQSESKISSYKFLIHKAISKDLDNLFQAAQKDGLEISIISSFRSFDRQLVIWNEKWQGHRQVYSRHGRPLNITTMSDMEKYKSISLWSALPGLSRHHWGTDLDIFLAQTIEDGHQVELVPQEFEGDGVCSQLDLWLNDNLETYGFFRPYQNYRNGISEEPWHISHYATSQMILENFSYSECLRYLTQSAIQSKEFIANVFDHYRRQYFLNICPPNTLE